MQNEKLRPSNSKAMYGNNKFRTPIPVSHPTHSTFTRVESIKSSMQNQNSILIVVFGKTIKIEKGRKYQYGKERVKLCFARTEMAS